MAAPGGAGPILTDGAREAVSDKAAESAHFDRLAASDRGAGCACPPYPRGPPPGPHGTTGDVGPYLTALTRCRFSSRLTGCGGEGSNRCMARVCWPDESRI